MVVQTFIEFNLDIVAEKLHNLMKEFTKVKKIDKTYWGNPQVYITSGIEAAPHDAHFILYDFKTSGLQPLGSYLKGINVLGELRYETKKMPIAFGRIKRIFIDAANFESDVWLVASSGVYLLKYQNVAPEYKETHCKYLKQLCKST